MKVRRTTFDPQYADDRLSTTCAPSNVSIDQFRVAKRIYYKLMYAFIIIYKTSILLINIRVFCNNIVVDTSTDLGGHTKIEMNSGYLTENSLDND